MVTAPTNRYGMGLGIHWQANQSITRAQIAAAGAAARGALARFDGVVLTALRDTESALATYAHDRQRDEDLATAQARAREAEQEAQRLHSGGKIDFLSLLDAQRTMASADGALGCFARPTRDRSDRHISRAWGRLGVARWVARARHASHRAINTTMIASGRRDDSRRST